MHHLGKDQITRLRELLDQAEESLRNRLRWTDGDDAVGAASAEVGQAVSSMELKELLDIIDARSRMADQSYGLCIDCGAEIDAKRLLAYPTAKRCLECQSLHERKRGQLTS